MGRHWIAVPAWVAVVAVAAVVVLAAPAGAIPIDPGGSPCASTSTASLSASPSTVALGQSTTTVGWSVHPGPGCSPTVVRLMFRDATTSVVTDTGLRGSAGSVALAPQSSGVYFLRAVING